MPLEHLQFLPVLQADDVVGGDRLPDRHGGLLIGGGFGDLLRQAKHLQRLMDRADQRRKVGRLNDVPRHIRRHDLAGQFDEVVSHGCHVVAPLVDASGIPPTDPPGKELCEPKGGPFRSNQVSEGSG